MQSIEEQAKLLSAFFNNIGVAVVSVGVVTPCVTYLYDPVRVHPNAALWLLYAAASIGVGFICHLVGAAILKDLDP